MKCDCMSIILYLKCNIKINYSIETLLQLLKESPIKIKSRKDDIKVLLSGN